MTAAFELIGSLGVAKILSISVSLAGLQAPVSWSPDGRWIAYTAADIRATGPCTADWLFEPTTEAPSSPQVGPEPSDTPQPQGTTVFRIWATQFGSQQSALLEESESPVGSPTWRPDGKAIAFARYIPKERDGQRLRGRFEVIVKEGLTSRRVIHAIEEIELDGSKLGEFISSAPAWNRDGSTLAVSRPGDSAAVLIIDQRTGRLVRTIANASRPAWSPNGSRLAAVRISQPGATGDELIVLDSPLVDSPRTLLREERIIQSPMWSGDGQSVLAVYWKNRIVSSGRATSREISLGRVSAATGEKSREWSLGSEPILQRPFPRMGDGREVRRPAPAAIATGSRPGTLLGCHFEYHPESEEIFHVTEQAGMASPLVCYNLRTDITHKRFPPLDLSIGIGAMAISPDGQTLAIRFRPWDPNRISAPAFCDIATENLSITAPDEQTRIDWLLSLSRSSKAILLSTLPSPTVPGVGIARRPVLLPVPGEIPPVHQMAPRLRRLARLGRSLSEGTAISPGESGQSGNGPFLAEARLFFDYLGGDMMAAETALDQLETFPLTPRQRSSLLGVRVQILMTKGDLPASLSIIDYLTGLEPERILTVEETPAGTSVKEVANARRSWGNYLSNRHDDLTKKLSQQQKIAQPDELNAIPPRPADPTDEFNREGGLRMPFVPFDPELRLFVEPK